MLVKNPGFTTVAVTALALGIGVNSTVFTFVNAVLLRGLPFEDSHRIMHLENNKLSERQESIEVSYADYLDWRQQSESFEGLGAADEGTMNVSDQTGAPERVRGAWVTANTFPLLGQERLMGRNFLPGEDEPGAEPVAILGYGVWQNRYGGDPEILGKTIRVNEVASTVVGVMPEGMKFPEAAEMWRPIDFNTEQREERDRRRLEVFGRLNEETSIAQARVEMTSIAQRLEAEYPDTNEGIGAVVKPYNDEYHGGEIKLLFLTLMGAVGFVLLIPARTSPICCSRGLPNACAKSPSAPRWERAAGASFSNCSSRAFFSARSAVPWVSCCRCGEYARSSSLWPTSTSLTGSISHWTLRW